MKKIDYKWTALALLWVAFFLQQGTRQLLGPSLSSIMASTRADAVQAGVVGTAFTLAYGICVPCAGIAADLVPRKWMVTIGVALFSLGVVLSGFVASIGVLIVTYGLLNGCGQTFYYPPATSLVAQLHKDSRATAMSILQLGLYLGIVGCGGFAGWCAGRGGDGWRLPFWIFGGAGLLWTLVLAFRLKDVKPEAPAGAAAGAAAEKPSVREAFKATFTKPTALAIAVGLGMWVYVDVGFKIWMPNHLQETFAVTKGAAGLHAVLWHYLGAAAGIVLASRLGDRLVARRPGIRLELGAVGLAAATPFIVWMAYAHTFAACCWAMGLFGFFRGVYDSNFMASFFDVVDPRYRASGVGLMMGMAFAFGSLSPVALGWTKAHVAASAGASPLAAGLASLAAVYGVGALVIALARVFTLKRDLVK